MKGFLHKIMFTARAFVLEIQMATQSAASIKRYDVQVPGDKENRKLAFVLENVLTKEVQFLNYKAYP